MADVALTAADADLARRFAGVTRLYGEAGAARLRGAHVAVVGVGGVGSWVAEALARSAVGRIRLIDMDHIAESNTNRQIHALGDSYGQAKVAAMAERIAAINPACDIQPVDEFITADNAARLIAGAALVVDCIDQVIAKAALIAQARHERVDVVTCGAAGGRIDAARIAIGDLGLIKGDPLLAKVRHRLRRDHGFPRDDARRKRFEVLAVYSDEPLQRPSTTCDADFVGGLACAGYGSSVAVTAAMGFVAASAALNRIAAAAQRSA